jgi:N-acetylmuramoyl-L-alanine amidase
MRRIILGMKKLAVALIMAALIVTNFGQMHNSHALLTTGGGTQPQIVVRCGEYGNDDTVKAGKRAYINNEIYEQVKESIKVRQDEHGMFISEFDINQKLSTRIAQKLSQKGVRVDLQISSEKSQDLNAAGRWAAKKNPDIYFSVHHNSYAENSSGYFFMVNNKDNVAAKVAQQLSESLKSNPMNIPQMYNRENDGYIGEMNVMGKTDSINILGEFGFFSNPNELVKICSDEQVEYIAEQMSNELIKTLEMCQK